MANIIVDEKVINVKGEEGRIVSFDEDYIFVQFSNRTAKLQIDAFEKEFLRYEKAELQSKINEGLQLVKIQEENKRKDTERAEEECRKMEAQAPVGVKFNSVSIRLEPATASFSSVKSKHRAFVKEIFGECDKDIKSYYELFHPTMRYIAPSYIYNNLESLSLRSRYCVGFVTKYLNTCVFRVFSRNDVYRPGKMGGCTVTNSDITEILRILCIDDEVYYFSKHLSSTNGSYKNTTSYNRWQASPYVELVQLDEVIRKCDCGYLNDYIDGKNVSCLHYAKLLMAAQHNNKVEIAFKNKMFYVTANIDKIEEYLEEYSSKQIDFACKNDVFNTLPIIKSSGLYDVDTLQKLEKIMRKRAKDSIYDNIVALFRRNNFDESVIHKKLIGFVKREDNVNFIVYGDYIRELAEQQNITVDDIFDKDYFERHINMQLEKNIYYSAKEANQYRQIAEELSWINREDNGYYIIVPKTIAEFKYEGQVQHNCVYTCQYYKNVIEKSSIIIFLRKEKDIPFVTIEISYKTFKIRQALGKYNKEISSELYKYIEDLAKELHYEMISHE